MSPHVRFSPVETFMANKKVANKQHLATASKTHLKTQAGETTENKSLGEFPIVGIGASAGGLAAFEAFFSGMPLDTQPGMAFVLVQHLAPDHQSSLAQLVRHYTSMNVFEVEDGMQVQINCTYIIPPNRDMAFLNGRLHLLEPAEPRGHRLPIDVLFHSLAQDQHQRAIGIVLSGTGSDGTLGVRAIKSEGGMVMAQHPDLSEFDGMPRSAIATGLVDYELAPAQMPKQLIAYVAQAFNRPPGLAVSPPNLNEHALKKIFILLRAQTSHDFSQYKPSTICRRIERRMAVHQLLAIEAYVKYLQQTPEEVDALFRDLLIGVTNFFRDPETFTVLEKKIIPELLDDKPASSTIRIWSAGCSTGEEAYSIAILLFERMEVLKINFKIQVFATDIDKRAIGIARAGVYHAGIADDISPDRLARFFTAEPDGSGYRIHKNIRDLLVFSEHDLIKDPPFSKLDMISCRNLLIYMSSDLQKKIITLFHYALNLNGMLFLGTSESVGEFGNLFASLDRKAKIFQRKEDFQGEKRAALNRFLPASRGRDSLPPADGIDSNNNNLSVTPKMSLRELTEQTLLHCINPACALVNGIGDILYLHGRTGLFLEPSPGEAGINNILKMAREGLRRHLTTALHKVASKNDTVRIINVRVKTNSHFTLVNFTICPAHSGAMQSPLFLIILEEAGIPNANINVAQSPPASLRADNSTKDAVGQIAELNEELQAKDEYLNAANEELETSNEELKSSNEEMQSINEELQSTNEELETSKEELQSINEELATVNTELQTKVTDLSRANNDMNNLLAGTGIGTVFVDHHLCILRFTPAATLIINLILSDVGRSIGHIVSNLINYDSLVVDIQEVLKSLAPKEVDVQTIDHKWYTMRMLPYRTLENVIEGAVITFVDITEVVAIREALRIANQPLPSV